MNIFSQSKTCLLLTLYFCLTVLSAGYCAEIEDSTVFVDAFNAYQQKDYLLVLEKCDQINQAFPDSPLRDVTLLLIARASLKSGDNERAAKTAVLFSSEFPDSSLKTTIENELLTLVRKHQNGDTLAFDKTLLSAAQKVKYDRIARIQAAELKLEMERAAKAKAEQERLASIKLEEERREKERVLAEKRAKASITASISFPEAVEPFAVGSNCTLPFTFSNRGKESEDFLLTVATAKEYNATLSYAGKPVDVGTRLKIAPGETIKGTIAFKMPAEMVDGHRAVMTVKAVSAKFGDVTFQNETLVITSAPLVRTVAKLTKPSVFPGENLGYRITVLNAGSLAARDLYVRLQLPTSVEFQSAPDVSFEQEPDGILVFKLDKIDTGRLVEINLDVKIRENSIVGQELRGQVTVINNNLQKRDIFTSRTSVVRAKQ
jgi:hypothetical protein